MPETEPKVLPASDRRRTPSIEGGGETAEVAVYPADSNTSEFEWKVSLTSVARPDDIVVTRQSAR